MNARLLDRDVTATFASLNHCRTDAASRKRAPPAHITMDTLTLRWTIAGKGQVAAMDVVGSTPLYPDVLDCINRDTNGWLFMSPVGGEARLNRALGVSAPVFRRRAALTFAGAGGRVAAKMSWRATSQMATTAGCLILRSTEMA